MIRALPSRCEREGCDCGGFEIEGQSSRGETVRYKLVPHMAEAVITLFGPDTDVRDALVDDVLGAVLRMLGELQLRQMATAPRQFSFQIEVELDAPRLMLREAIQQAVLDWEESVP